MAGHDDDLDLRRNGAQNGLVPMFMKVVVLIMVVVVGGGRSGGDGGGGCNGDGGVVVMGGFKFKSRLINIDRRTGKMCRPFSAMAKLACSALQRVANVLFTATQTGMRL